MPDAQPAAPLRLTALSLVEVAQVLSRAGRHPVSMEMLRADTEAGAPVNADGTMNLIAYAAWLARALAHAD